ncbi:homeobox protein VENTX [Sceloporus undulatus]|uniref:homeobox protein VENTX n=1 Tax=Sceloporus undulatus TaxID=8520 RepID=UPI001C4C317C|nr:homeobox protein VENTX [Sceloporus undulatus]
MTKAPYASVAWLSQSSRATKDVPEAPNSTSPIGPIQGQPRGAEGPPTLGQVPPKTQGTPPSGAQTLGLSASSPAALVAPKREWSASECSSDGEGSLSEGQRPEPGSSGGRSTGSRRLRTAFSLEQISTLESSFKRHRYLGAAERRKLATKMQLSEVQIKTWFQNRRMKLKRQMQEMRSEAYHTVPFYSPLPFGPQNGPLSYVYSPHQQTLSRREAPIPSGLPLPPLPAPLVDPRNASAGQPGTLWPLPLPYVMGYQDPRTVFMTL